MDARWNRPKKTGVWLFMAGALIGFILFSAAFIQDTEAIVFSAIVKGDDTLRSLTCPEIITRGEMGKVSAIISNRSDKRLYRYVRAHISQGYLMMKREENESFYLDPGESRKVTWEVTSDDAAWGYLIMAKVYVFPQKPYPSFVGTCGIMLFDLPFTKGLYLMAEISAISMILMGIGYRRYVLDNQPLVRKKRTLANNLLAIAVTVLVGIGALFFELYMFELTLFMFTAILLAESTFQFSQT